MTLEQVNDAGDKFNPICHVCGREKTYRLPSGGLLCEHSHHQQRTEAYARQAESRGDYAGASSLRKEMGLK